MHPHRNKVKKKLTEPTKTDPLNKGSPFPEEKTLKTSKEIDSIDRFGIFMSVSNTVVDPGFWKVNRDHRPY